MKTKQIKNIFLSSIYQNAGKTSISLGLYKILQERKIKTAFMKPIGQEYVHVGEINIDKDSYLIGEVFHTKKRFRAMSPVTIGRGYTEKYIFNPHKDKIEEKIVKAYKNLIKGKEAIIVEGTGHAGVGAVIDFSNADVARLLGAKVIIIGEGGIGKSIDEIVLNKALFDLRGVEVIGVIVNKVMPEKYEKVEPALRRGLANKGIRLLGVLPLDPLLSIPTVEQIKDALEGGADVILLDNMTVDEIRAAVELVAGRAIVEASGGITLENVRAIAATGVQLISVGRLTHSAPALDISLELEA